MNKAKASKITSWYLINIKARRNQTPKHYEDVFRKLFELDPAIDIKRDRYISMQSIDYSRSKKENVSNWIHLTLVQYNIINSDAFYNRRQKKDVKNLIWDPDVVANKKDSELIFVPANHILALRKYSKIRLNSIVTFLSEALNKIEEDGFDVNVIVDRDELSRILRAHTIYSIKARLSYSNAGHSNGFTKALDKSMRDDKVSAMEIKLNGTKNYPLELTNDGLISAVVNQAEANGTIEASITEEKGGKRIVINSKSHPRTINIAHNNHNTIQNIYGTLINITL